jgi:hypothetical protein
MEWREYFFDMESKRELFDVAATCSIKPNFYRQPIASLSLKNINLASKINMDRRDSHTELFDVLASCSIKTKFSRENLLPVLLDH